MNNANFNQTGGFPLQTDSLAFMQEAYTQLAGIARLGGDDYILSGAEVDGTTVAAGVVVIDGELLPLEGGEKLEYLDIVEVVENRTFETGESKPVYHHRKAVFAAAGAVAFDSLPRVSSVVALQQAMLTQTGGVWTPTAGSGLTFTTVQCSYFRIGKLWVLSGDLVISHGTGGENTWVSFGNLPFTNTGLNSAQYGFFSMQQYPAEGPVTTGAFDKSQSGSGLSFTVDMDAETQYKVRFSITIFQA